MPLISNLSVEYQKALYESPYRKELVEKIGPVAFKNIELAMKSVDEKILPLMQEENELTTRYNNLLASCKIIHSVVPVLVNFMEKSATSLSCHPIFITETARYVRKHGKHIPLSLWSTKKNSIGSMIVW